MTIPPQRGGIVARAVAEFDAARSGRMVVSGVAAGVLSGAGVIALLTATRGAITLAGALFGAPGGDDPAALGMLLAGADRYLWAALAVAGALLAGLLAVWVPEAAGGGLDEVITEVHEDAGRIRRRSGPAKVIAGAAMIGTGSSGGIEGPAAFVGAAMTRLLSRPLRLTPRERRTLLIAGCAGGIGGAFQAPLGGAIFAVEVLYAEPEFEAEALVPSLIASIVSYSMVRIARPRGFLFSLPEGLTFGHPLELVPYAALAALIVLLSWGYLGLSRGLIAPLFGRLPLPRSLRPVVGACVVALMIAAQPLLAGPGYYLVDLVISDGGTPAWLLGMIGLKILATAVSAGSGGAAGTFAPTVTIGTLAGIAMGLLAAQSGYPWLAPLPAFAVVGMGGMFAALSNVPLAMIVMTAEMTRGYGLLVPTMLVVTLCYAFAPRRRPFHAGQVPNRLFSPAHVDDVVEDPLAGLRVADLVRRDAAVIVRGTARLLDLRGRAAGAAGAFVVLDDEDRLLGTLRVRDVERALRTFWVDATLEVGDVLEAESALSPAEALRPDDSLRAALQRMARAATEDLPVVDADGRWLGMVYRRDALVAYHERVQLRARPA